MAFKRRREDETTESPLERCHHYNDISEVPWDLQKYASTNCLLCQRLLKHVARYFQQRYSIFSKYDEGILMTDDAWFGVTPEPVAESVCRFTWIWHLLRFYPVRSLSIFLTVCHRKLQL